MGSRMRPPRFRAGGGLTRQPIRGGTPLIDPGLRLAVADPLDRSQNFPHIGSLVVRCAQGDLGLEVEGLVLKERPHGAPICGGKIARMASLTSEGSAVTVGISPAEWLAHRRRRCHEQD